ncbi:sporulation-specific protein 15-like isoform X2 [Homarus americanus]|uniref:sporulation-specific protein 15-like isoform X2 n=1 Tax=Homarus americanus TaxID=6706 RepID=UPI001C43B049|nr:sporulation-specific protein 15-like isoform X2 [Homarus americanus]
MERREDSSELHQSHPVKEAGSISLCEGGGQREEDDESKHLESMSVSSSHSGRPQFSLPSKGSRRSHKNLLGDMDQRDYEGDGEISHTSVRSSSRTSNSRGESSRAWQHKRRKSEISQGDTCSTDDQDDDLCHSRSVSDGGETVNETSLEETSFNTSVYSDKGVDSSSELSIDPEIWTKFKFLSSILKETQHNLRAMDNLILEHRRLQNQAEQNKEHTIVSHVTIPIHQGLGDGEPKTDEAKLEEILSLLHNLTHTLTSYEQHPLLVSTPHPAGTSAASVSLGSIHHVQQTPQHSQTKNIEHGGLSSHSHYSAHPQHASSSHQPTQPQNLPPSIWQEKDIEVEGLVHKPIDEFGSAAQWSHSVDVSVASDVVNVNSNMYTNGVQQTLCHSHDPAYTNVGLLGVQHDATRSVFTNYSPHGSMTERNMEKTALDNDFQATSSNVLHYFKSFTKDNISQVVPSVNEEHPNTQVFYYQTGHHNEGLDSLQGQNSCHHPLMKETRSLRKDIDDIVMRKQVLDSRLQSLIAHRAAQRELELKQLETANGRHIRLMRSQSLEEIDNRRLRAKIKKYKSRSKSYEENGHHQRKSSTSVGETYLSMIDEDQDEFPSLKMENLENEEKITELQNDEADLPGLGDSGLSSEINSINATIQELVRENHQLHKFLQGMTSESILKVDQEKLALEAQINLLSEENQALKLSLNVDDDDDDTEPEDKSKQTNKAVSFFIEQNNNQDPQETKINNKTTKTKRVKVEGDNEPAHDRLDQSSTSSMTHTQSTTEEDLEKIVTGEEALSHTKSQISVDNESTTSLREEVEHLSQENQKLFKTIMEERKMNEEQKQLIKKYESEANEKKDAQITQIVLKDDLYTEEMCNSKEIEKLKLKIKKLTEEKQDLNHRLSEEVSERDLESARLEARIRILSEQNQNMTRKLDEVKIKSKAEKDEKGCQSEAPVVIAHDNRVTDDGDSDSILTVTVKKVGVENTNHQPTAGLTDRATVVRDPDSTERMPNGESCKTVVDGTCPGDVVTRKIDGDSLVIVNGSITARTPSEKVNVMSSVDNTAETTVSNTGPSQSNVSADLVKHVENGEVVSSFTSRPGVNTTNENNLETTSDIIASQYCIASTSMADKSEASVIGGKTNFAKTTTGVQTISNAENIPSHICDENLRIDDSKLIVQLWELLKQNEVIASGLNDLKSSTVNSETNLEYTIMRVMEEHGKLIQNIDQKLTSAAASDRSNYEFRLGKLAKENEELTTTLEKQMGKIELLVNQNASLERKLQLARAGSKEKCSVYEDAKTLHDTTLGEFHISTDETLAHQEEQIDPELEGNIIHITPEEEEPNQDLGMLKKKNLKKETAARTTTSTESVLEGKRRFSMTKAYQQSSAESQPSIPLETGINEENNISCGGNDKQLSRPQGPVLDEKEGASVGQNEGYISESEGLLNLTFRREKENWTRLIEQAENQKQILQDRIITLANENDCLASRLEEVVEVSRNLSDQMYSAKEQLVKVVAEKEDLQKRLRSLEDGKDDSSLTLSDSIGSTRLTQRLKERTRNLQSEVERAWQEAHQRTIERDRISAEKESLQHTSSITLSTSKKEVEELKGQITALQEEKNKRCLELTNTQNELDKKSADVRAANDNNASQWERLMETDRRLESLQNEFKKGQEQLQKEIDGRKNAETQLEEIKKEKTSSASLPAMAAESELVLARGERYWLETVTQLKGQLHQEQLRSRLLEAADHESSARILILQRSVRETIEAHENLQAKYNQLRAAYRAKKAEKIRHRELSQQYTAQVKELGKTSAALEENLKVMLSTLGENIDVTVGILTSHVFLSPCVVHPGPDLRLDPDAWFGAQQARLRWLQTQLRKLCLHSWKTADLPRTSNFGSTWTEHCVTGQQSSQLTDDISKTSTFSKDVGHQQSSCAKKNDLSELSILDESRSYASTPVKKVPEVQQLTVQTWCITWEFLFCISYKPSPK